MTDSANGNHRGDPERFKWLKKRLLPLAGLLLAIFITAIIFYLFQEHLIELKELSSLGYLGAFVISMIFNATLILPVGNMAILIALGATLPSPALVGLAGGLGAALGELTGYLAGRSGRALISRSRMYTRIEVRVQRWGWLAVFVLSVVPFIFDLVGLAAGAIRLPLWKFFLACWVGRTLLYVAAIMAGAYGLRQWVPWFV